MKYATLTYSNFCGFPHYYGRLRIGNADETITLSHVLSVSYARRLSESDFKYRKGMTSEKFFSIQELVDESLKVLPNDIEAIFAFDGIPAAVLWHKDPAKMDVANDVVIRYDKVAHSRKTPNSVLYALCDEWGAVLGIDWRAL